MRTLDEVDQLQQSGFGRPKPRHGLKLLYWFTTDCLTVDQNNALQLCCHPVNGDYGFHRFENRYERNGGKLLPDGSFYYYAVGNLSKSAAYNMPAYVRENYTGNRDNSNMDRIIISINNGRFQAVYVTAHSDRSNFNKWATFQISKRLIILIRGLRLDDFLWQTGYSTLQPSNNSKYLKSFQSNSIASPTTFKSTPAITPSGSQFSRVSNLQPPSRVTSSSNRFIDIESGLSDDTYPRGTRNRSKCCCCTIL